MAAEAETTAAVAEAEDKDGKSFRDCRFLHFFSVEMKNGAICNLQ
jgi:hypothetical protein